MSEQFYLDKTTSTFADELLAAGFLRLLRQLLDAQGDGQANLTQIDRGTHFEIVSPIAVNLHQLANFRQVCVPLIRTEKNAGTLPQNLPLNPNIVVQYETERDQRRAHIDAYKLLPDTLKRADLAGETVSGAEWDALPPKPHPDWDIFQALNPPALPSYNSTVGQWYEAMQTANIPTLQLLLNLFRHTPNDIATAQAAWQKLAKTNGWKVTTATAAQLLNPAQGKGINRPKTNGVNAGNLDNFWLLEYLKAVGLYEMAFTRPLQGIKDRKTYVLSPGHLTLQTHRQIKADFRQTMRFSETAIRSDILTVIRYLRAFLRYVQQTQSQTRSPLATLMRHNSLKPRDFVRGFHVAYYKDMGNATALMNLAFLNLPGWVTVTNSQDPTDYQTILEEHEKIARQFREDRGEEILLLQSYRDFIVADNLDPFFDFTTAYSSYIIRQREKRAGFAQQFQEENLRRLIMNSEPTYSTILENDGFQNIAYAIRQSTVTAQYRSKSGDRRYDVRYGLGLELSRKSQYKNEFIAALSDFLHKYNAENAQVMESRPGPYRRSIHTDDIKQIVTLIDRYGSDLICKMLIAFGYARESRPEETATEAK